MAETPLVQGANYNSPFVVSEQKGFWIPIEIWQRKDISLHEKLVLADVNSMQNAGRTYFKSNQRIADDLGCSTATVKRSIGKLRAMNLLQYGSINQGNVRVLEVGQIDQAQDAPAGGSKRTKPRVKKNSAKAQVDLHNSKVNRTDNSSVNTSEMVYPWQTDTFAEAWSIWLDERNQRKTKRYTPRGQQTALHALQKLADNDEQTAIAIIHQSIAQGWQGLFALKRSSATKPEIDADQLRTYINTGSI